MGGKSGINLKVWGSSPALHLALPRMPVKRQDRNTISVALLGSWSCARLVAYTVVGGGQQHLQNSICSLPTAPAASLSTDLLLKSVWNCFFIARVQDGLDMKDAKGIYNAFQGKNKNQQHQQVPRPLAARNVLASSQSVVGC